MKALLMGLRLVEGLDLSELEARFGRPRASMVSEKALAQYKDLGFVWQRGARIGVERKGMGVLNTLIEALVADELVAP